MSGTGKSLGRVKAGCILSIKKHLAKALSSDEVRWAISDVEGATTVKKAREVYYFYRDLAKSVVASTQAMTGEYIDLDERGDPVEDYEKALRTIQQFARARNSDQLVKLGKPKKPEHRTVKSTQYTSHQLSLETWSAYQKRRQREMVEFFRKYKYPRNVQQQMELAVQNQEERFQIIKEYERELNKIRHEHGVISVGELKKLDAKDFYNTEFLIKYDQYLDLIQKLEKGKTDFMNIFLQYLEFHEQALQMYKNEINEMFINFVSIATEMSKKETSKRQQEFEQETVTRQQLEHDEGG